MSNLFHDNLFFILCILLGVLIIQQFINTTYYDNLLSYMNGNGNTYKSVEGFSNNSVSNDALRDAKRKIEKAVEAGMREGFQNEIQENPTYLNRDPLVKLQLFYKPSCPHCRNFMPVWSRIINNLPANATYEEINCETDIKKAAENKITTVPSIFLIINDTKTQYHGNRSYKDIDAFLRANGVALVERRFEEFGDLDSNPDGNPDQKLNPNCPSVSFDKDLDIANDKYLYQIFNADGQFGYAVGGYNEDKVMTPFAAAYSTIDSYLSSLPDIDNPGKNTYKNIDECAGLYAQNIINFGLCDANELNKIAEYQKNIKSGNYKSRVDGGSDRDYNDNEKVVAAIKKVCNMDY